MIHAVARRAQFIVMELSGGYWLLVHLRMTGQIRVEDSEAGGDAHDRLVLRLADGRLVRYHDTRTFGRWYLVKDPLTVLAHLGVEPLDPGFTPATLQRMVHSHTRMLKPLLLDQTVIAGLGNIYVDEALFAARLHPARRSSTLRPEEVSALHRSIRQVLRDGIRNRGTTLGSGETNFHSVGGRRGRNRDGLKVFRRTGAPCPNCGRPIHRIVVGQRSTHVCELCQR